jgi:hypothetical protein
MFLQEAELEAAAVIGYDAVKYFDLKQHSTTNYMFSYERMLGTKGRSILFFLLFVCLFVCLLFFNFDCFEVSYLSIFYKLLIYFKY